MLVYLGKATAVAAATPLAVVRVVLGVVMALPLQVLMLETAGITVEEKGLGEPHMRQEVRFVLSGPEIHGNSHPLIQATYNEILY